MVSGKRSQAHSVHRHSSQAFVPSTKTCSVGVKAERQFGDVFFWVLAGIPAPESDRPLECFIIPGAEMARNVDRWDLIELVLEG
jgi:hypothetical protein